AGRAVKLSARPRATVLRLCGKTPLTSLRRKQKKFRRLETKVRPFALTILVGKTEARHGGHWTPAMGHRRRLHTLRKLLFRPRVDLPRDRLHSQCRRARRAHRDYHFLRQPGAGRPFPRARRRPPHVALALQ